jgi:RNA polymerase sigma-70 factor (ECF subfamily)
VEQLEPKPVTDGVPPGLDSDSVDPLIQVARSGSQEGREALGGLLDGWRDYLLLLANQELDSVLCPKAGASDLVQETFLEAQQGFDQFQGHTAPELVAWLRTILEHNVANFARRYQQTAKRDISREVPLHEILQSDSFRMGVHEQNIVANEDTPSAVLASEEEAEAVRQSLEKLPEAYRSVIELRYQQGYSFAEIGQRLDRSAEAARKLWFRAIRRLSENLDVNHESTPKAPGRSPDRPTGGV